MLKQGRYRAIRNLCIGWITHAIHSTDYSERIFRIIIEILLMLVLLIYFYYWSPFQRDIIASAIVAFIVSHTIMWLLDGNFWVYVLDSFDWMKNPGIDKIVSYVKLCRKLFQLGDLTEAILIFGSMSRGEFHNKSDLDLRIVRRKDSILGILCLPVALFLRALSFFMVLPVDLQVSDSFNFLDRQMRKDEIPIVVYTRDSFRFRESKNNFCEIEKNPSSVFVIKKNK